MAASSRRRLFQTAIVAAAAPLATLAQTAPAADPLPDARKNLADNAKAVAAVTLPQSVEPAFEFKV